MDRRAHVNRNLQFSITLCDTTFYLTETESKNNPRYRYMIRKGQFYRHNVHGNSVHKSMSSWWLAWKFLDSTRVVWVPGPDLLS